MADFFVWGNGGQKLSQDDINDQLRYGDQLTQQSQQTPAIIGRRVPPIS